MKADRIVLGLALAFVGVVWFLVNLGVISPVVARDFWRFWPLLLVLWGVLMLLGKGNGLGGCLIGILVFFLFFGGIFGVYLPGVQGPGGSEQEVRFSVPDRDDIEQVELSLLQAAGEVNLSAHPGTDLLRANLFGTVHPQITEAVVGNDTLEVTIEEDSSWSVGTRSSTWDVQLAENTPLAISMRSGAGRAVLDLSSLQVHSLDVKTGAGELVVHLSEVDSQVLVEGGAGSITLYVPDDVGVRVQTSGLLNLNTDDINVFRLEGVYESEDIDSKAAVADIEIKAGVGAVNVRRAR